MSSSAICGNDLLAPSAKIEKKSLDELSVYVCILYFFLVFVFVFVFV